jgi:hypothetical protein
MSTGNGTVPTADEVEALRVAWEDVAITWQQLRTEAAAGRAYHDARKALEAATVPPG